MDFTAKRHIVIGLLVTLGLWPLAHHAIVRATGLSPWKGFGWSMYCVPARKVMAYVIDPETNLQLPFKQALMEPYQRFGAKRAELGHWVQPNEFAAEILRQFPDENEVDIYVEHRIVARSSARIERERIERFRYQREPQGGTKLIEVEQLGLDGRPLAR